MTRRTSGFAAVATSLLLLAACAGGDQRSSTPAAQGPTTTDMTTVPVGDALRTDSAGRLGVDHPPMYGRGVSVIDLDGDGREDLFLADTDSRLNGDNYVGSIAYRNLGDRFEPWDLGLDPADTFLNVASVFGDYTGDGAPDVLLVNGNNTGTGTMALYENRLATEGRFVDRTEAAGITDDVGLWWGATSGDIDADGRLDLLIAGPRTILYRNVGGGRMEEVSEERGLAVFDARPIARNPVFVDVDDDADVDLLSGGGTPHVLLRNDGTGHFVDATAEAFAGSLDEDWWSESFAVSVADFDQDGHDDLYVGRFWFQDALFLNDGAGHFTRHDTDIGLITQVVPEGSMTLNPSGSTWIQQGRAPEWGVRQPPTGVTESENTMGLTVGDLDGNGHPDVVIGTGDPATANLDLAFCVYPDPTTRIQLRRCEASALGAVGPTRGHGMAVADLDQDGANDLVISPGGFPPYDASAGTDSRELTRILLGGRPDSEVARIRLVTRGRAAVGARMSVMSPTPRYGTVRSNEGFQSQGSQVLSFRIEEPTEIRVVWLGGRVSTHTIGPGQRTTIEEPDG